MTRAEGNAKWWTLGVMCLSMFMVMLDGTVVNVALPSIQHDLDATLDTLEWTVNGYTLALAAVLVTGGRLGDIFGRRRMFMLGAGLFAGASATAGLAPDMTSLVISRVVEGLGAALMLPATLSIITNAFPAEERGKAIGIWAGVSALALSIGPLVGGLLTEQVSWRAIFFVNVPIGAVAIVAALKIVRESTDPGAGRSIDYGGVLSLGVGLMALVLALVEANARGWGSPRIIALLVVSVVLLAAFVVIELRAKEPMLALPLFKERTFVGAVLVAAVISFAMTGVFFFFALYMQEILDFSPIEAGVRFLPATVALAIFAPIAGRLTDRIGPRIPMAVGLATTSVAMYGLSKVDIQTTYSDIWLPFLALGIGIGLTMSPMSTAAMSAVPQEKAGVASGVLSSFRFVGGTFGVAVLGAVFQSGVSLKLGQLLSGYPSSVVDKVTDVVIGQTKAPSSSDLSTSEMEQIVTAGREAFVSGIGQAFEVAAIVAIVAAVVAVVMVRKRPVKHDHPIPAVAGS